MQAMPEKQHQEVSTLANPFQIYLTKGQVQALGKLLPLRYSLQPQPKKKGNPLKCSINKNKQISNFPKSRQLSNILEQIKDNEQTTDNKQIDRCSSVKDNLRSTSLKNKSISTTNLPLNQIHQNTERQFYGDLMLAFLDSVKQKSNIVKFYKEQLKIIEEKIVGSLSYSMTEFEEDFYEIFKISEKPRSNRKLGVQNEINSLYSKWKENIKLEVQNGRNSQNQTETHQENKEKCCQLLQTKPNHKVKKSNKQLIPPKEVQKPKNLTKKMGKTNKQWQAKLQKPKLTKTGETSNSIVNHSQKISFPEACKIMRRLKILTDQECQSVLEDAKMSNVDILTIRQSSKGDLKVFLGSLNKILQSKYNLSLSDEESNSESEEYIESSFEVQDEF